jgi:hypothetical protein
MPIKHDFEEELAFKFAPTYIPSGGEDRYLVELEPLSQPKIGLAHPPWKPCIYYSVIKHSSKDNDDLYEITYLSIWDWDTGGRYSAFKKHQWDTERTAILVKGPFDESNVDSFKAQEAYFAAHEGEILDGSKYKDKLANRSKGVKVYWSLGKHASYSSKRIPKAYSIVDKFTDPDEIAKPGDYLLKNVGNLKKPSQSTPWILHKTGWGPDNVTSVYEKLKSRVWGPSAELKAWWHPRSGTTTVENIKAIQRGLGQRPTGVIDPETFDKARFLSREIVGNAAKFEDDVFQDVLQLQLRQPTYIDTSDLINLQRRKSILHSKTLADSKGLNVIFLGNISPEHFIVGLMPPSEDKIVDYRIAVGRPISDRQINLSDLKPVRDGAGFKL